MYPFLTSTLDRCYSTTLAWSEKSDIRILWASQGGTAQLFGQELREILEEQGLAANADISLQGWHEVAHPSQLVTNDAINILLTSVTGFGEPPDNGRSFYDYLVAKNNGEGKDDDTDFHGISYAVFGLGNSKAHPNHYNTVSKLVDESLEALGATRIHSLGLGDDGDCIEDDFDVWTNSLIKTLKEHHSNITNDGPDSSSKELPLHEETKEEDKATASVQVTSSEDIRKIGCAGAKNPDGLRRISSNKYPQLRLQTPRWNHVCHDLFHLQGTNQQFYVDGAQKARVLQNHTLSAYSGEAGLREIVVETSSSYETGDHCLVYPRNDNFVVEAYLRHLDVDPHAIIEENISDAQQEFPYPYPTGLTVHETLSHCIDLGAPPSPSFARRLLNRSQGGLDYKQEIAIPRRTILSLMIQGGTVEKLALEDLLYQATPMKPRYYSIASSTLKDPHQFQLTFRPVKYLTTQGHMLEGICTNYMGSLFPRVSSTTTDPEEGTTSSQQQYITISLQSNPGFRLPKDRQTSVLMIAGGCGVAPIRAFCEERILLREKFGVEFGRGTLLLGFRSPEDQVYDELIQHALQVGALTDVKISYSSGWKRDTREENEETMTGCDCHGGNVNELVRQDAEHIWAHMQNGGVTYLCGGARTFGAAVEQEFLGAVLQDHGSMSFDEASAYLRKLAEDGMLLEDLAD